jgi:hypothetical protein
VDAGSTAKQRRSPFHLFRGAHPLECFCRGPCLLCGGVQSPDPSQDPGQLQSDARGFEWRHVSLEKVNGIFQAAARLFVIAACAGQESLE